MPHKLLFAFALTVAFFTAVALNGSGRSASAAAQLDSEEIAFVSLLNNYRAQNGLGSVTAIDTLDNAADWMSNDMGVKAYFSHNDSQNRSPWTRMCDFAYCYNTSKGENIAAGFTTAQSVFDAWRNSPGHNSNMLGSNFKVIGIARVFVAGSPYGYYWTNDFGGYVPGGSPVGGTVSPTASPTRSPTPSLVATASPTRTPTPAPTASPTKTPTPVPTVLPVTPTPTAAPLSTRTPSPTPKPTLTPRIIHDVGIGLFSVGTTAHTGDTIPIVFRVSNWGTVAESVNYGIVATCMDGNNNKVLECKPLQYSPACSGTVNVLAGKYVQVNCTVTYSGLTYHDRWRHTLTGTNSADTKAANNTRMLERHVY